MVDQKLVLLESFNATMGPSYGISSLDFCLDLRVDTMIPCDLSHVAGWIPGFFVSASVRKQKEPKSYKAFKSVKEIIEPWETDSLFFNIFFAKFNLRS